MNASPRPRRNSSSPISAWTVGICRLLVLSLAWILLGGAGGAAWCQTSASGSVVVDNGNLLNPADLAEIRAELADLERTTGIEGAVLTVHSISDYKTGDATIEAFARTMFDKWGIGHKPENNGFLIVVSKDDRKARIELGAGYEHRLDGAMQKVMDEVMVPAFRANDHSRGIKEGTRAVIGKVTRKVSWFEFHKWRLLAGLGVVFLLFAGFSAIAHGEHGWGYAFFAMAFSLTLGIFFSRNKSSEGFGGGSSGGGGATGSW